MANGERCAQVKSGQKGDLAGALSEFQAEAPENPDPSKALAEIAELQAGKLPEIDTPLYSYLAA